MVALSKVLRDLHSDHEQLKATVECIINKFGEGGDSDVSEDEEEEDNEQPWKRRRLDDTDLLASSSPCSTQGE